MAALCNLGNRTFDSILISEANDLRKIMRNVLKFKLEPK